MKSHFMIFLIISVTNVVAQNNVKQRVNVTVYYESLCPDAKQFIVHQLYPVLQGNLSKYVNLELIPYGKTNRTSDTNSNVSISCQHGPSECYGNTIQACSRNLIDYGNNSDNLGFNKNHLEFVKCFMERLNSQSTITDLENATDRCAKSTVIAAGRLKTCANNTFGAQLLMHYGNLTDSFRNPLKHVPTVVYNGLYNKEESDNSENNFLSALCLKIGNPQPECAKVPTQPRINTSSTSSIPHKPQLLILSSLILIIKNICTIST